MEIGSEFWIDGNCLLEDNNVMPPWLTRFGNVVLTTSGRGALSLVLEQVKPKIKKVLLPSYICDSIISPFEKAGYELTYYDVDKNFTPINIESIVNSNIGIFLHMAYFGFPTNGILSEVISSLKSESVIIIEDVTHTLFSENNKRIENDFIIGSIRKWFGTPSGGFLASYKNIKFELLDADSEFIDLRLSSLHKKSEYLKSGNKLMKSKYLSGFTRAEQLLDEDIKPYKIDHSSEAIINNFNYKRLKSSRKRNYEFLLKQLNGVNGIEVIFDNSEIDVTPMFFPVYVKRDRDKLRLSLIDMEIYCPIHWPIPKQLNGHLNSITKKIYDSILSIPCDQRYQIEDMQRITIEISNFLKE